LDYSSYENLGKEINQFANNWFLWYNVSISWKQRILAQMGSNEPKGGPR
jgi:hypothetical protein